jgi:hypothetical protein
MKTTRKLPNDTSFKNTVAGARLYDQNGEENDRHADTAQGDPEVKVSPGLER